MSIPSPHSCLNNLFSSLPNPSLLIAQQSATSLSNHQIHLYRVYVDVHLHLNDHKIIMDPPLFSAAYIIININKFGLPDSIIPHDEDKGTWISASIHLTLAVTRTPAGRQPFIDITATLLPRSSKSWRKDLTDDQVTDIFFVKMYAVFPPVINGDYLENEDFLAGTFRRESGTDGRNFDTCNQAIVINGVKSEKMWRAGVQAARSGDPNLKESKRFQTFMFALSKALYHELGHMFVTFLGGGVVDTPPHIVVHTPGEPLRASGEAGRFVENQLFGGLITVLKDEEDDGDQAGKLYLVTAQSTREISHKYIKDYVGFNFTFPIPEAEFGDPPKPGMHTLGYGKERNKHIGDPMDNAQVHMLLAAHDAEEPRWDQAFNNFLKENPNQVEMTAEMQVVLRRVPLNPALRLVEKPKDQTAAVK